MDFARRVARLWFGLRTPVDRRAYAASGIGLMAFKYASDAAAFWLVAGRAWTPLDYLWPLWSTRTRLLGIYGVTLFVGTPFAMGVVSALRLNRDGDRGIGRTLLVAQIALLLVAGTLLLFGLEGGFSELPPPHELVFALGIAYPMRARIHGEGVGATRHCEFSTGPFVEPITVWDRPHRLAFDVASQPEPLHETSPYRRVWAPHLEDGLRARRGEFRLVALAEGRTRLEGRTWYSVEMAPQLYWALYSDALIHAIHERVLAQVRRLAEREVAAGRAVARTAP